ncbi:hypothetical protein Peur_048156 [Populus x canadensis]
MNNSSSYFMDLGTAAKRMEQGLKSGRIRNPIVRFNVMSKNKSKEDSHKENMDQNHSIPHLKYRLFS